MKILIFFLIISGSSAFSQSNLVKGGQYMALKYGLSKYSIPTFGQYEWGWAFEEKMQLRAGAYFEHGTVGMTTFNIPGIYVDFLGTPFHLKNKVFFNLSIGPHFGMEFLRANSIPGREKAFQLTLGGKASAEVDFLISEQISIKTEFSEWYSHFTKIGKWYYTATIGLSFTLN